MNDCYRCPVEKECHYPFKVCDCVGQRKFWTIMQRKAYDEDHAKKMAALTITKEQLLSHPSHDRNS